MERTKKVPADKPKWKKIGGGTLRLSGRNGLIKSNQTFYAYESKIPKAFRDTVLLLEGDASAEPVKEPEVSKTVFEVQKNEDGKGWDVVNATSKKPINDNPIRTKKEAETLLETLQ